MRFLKICIFCIVFLALGITLVNVADLQKTNTNLNNQITQQEQTYSGKIDELTVYQEKLVERISLLEENYQKLQTAYDELKAAYDQFIADSTLERETIQGTVVDLRETIAVLENNADVDAETITALRAEVTTLETSLENQTTTANELQATVTQQEATIAELNTTIDALIAELNSDNELFQKLVAGQITELSAIDLGNIEYIRPYCFSSTNLKSIVLPDTVKNIGSYAFSMCDSLEQVTFPSSLVNIGHFAFENCGSLQIVDCSNNTNLQVISDGAFMQCMMLQEVNFNNCTSLRYIGNRAFGYCDGMKSMSFENCPVTTLGSEAFCGCSGVTSLDLSSFRLTTLADYCFYGVPLDELNLDFSEITTVGEYCFDQIFGDLTLNLSDFSNLVYIRERAFNQVKFENNQIIIPDTCTFIGLNAFTTITAISKCSVYLPSTCTTVNACFSGDTVVYTDASSFLSTWKFSSSLVNSYGVSLDEYLSIAG